MATLHSTERIRRAMWLPLVGALGLACLPMPAWGAEAGGVKLAGAAPAEADWLVTRKGLVYALEMGVVSGYQKRVTAFDETGRQTQSGKDASFAANRGGGLVPRGLARYDRHFALLTAGGSFIATGGINALLDACKSSGAFTFEALLTPSTTNLDRPGAVMQLGPSSGSPNLALQQEGNSLFFRLRTATGGRATESRTELLAWPDAKPHHLAVAYGASVLTVCLDGREVLHTAAVTGTLSRWRASELVFGDTYEGDANWPGKLEGVAFYDRALDAQTIQQQSLACRQRLAARKEPPRLRLVGKLKAFSETPSPEKIAPYYQALGVYEYTVDSVLEGTYTNPAIRVAEWVIMDRKKLPIVNRPLGASAELTLEPYAANPQLETDFWIVDTLDLSDLPLYYDVGP